MFYLELELVEDYFPELIKRLQWFDQSHVDIGMFASSGAHYSGFTYVNLFRYLSVGDSSRNLPPRPVMDIAFRFNPIEKSSLKRDLRIYLSNIKTKKTQKDAEMYKLWKGTGRYYRKAAYNVFGKESYLQPNAPLTKAIKESKGFNPNAPLVMTGELQEKIAYSVNDGTVWEYK